MNRRLVLFGLLLLSMLVAAGPTACAQSLLQIQSPTNQSIYQEGQTYTITLTADPSVQDIAVLPQSPLPDVQPTANPLQFTLTLPTNINPGSYSISAIGTVGGSLVSATPVMVQLERADVPVLIKAQPGFIGFPAVGDQQPILVWGTYADGTVLGISNSLQTSYTSNNTQVTTVVSSGYSGRGVATSTGVGQTSIVVQACACLFAPYTLNGPTVPVGVTVTQPPAGPAPVIANISTSVGTPGTTQVTVNGSNFGSAQGSGYVQLGTLSATTIASWTPTQIIATVPLGSMPGVVEVRQNGVASNDVPFTTVVPAITGVSTSSGASGTPVTITGNNFGAQASSSVMFNRGLASITSWSSGSIVATVPSSATTGNLVVISNGTPSNAVGFTVPPVIANLQPNQAAVGATVTVNGTSFGGAQETNTIAFNGTPAAASTWGTTAIQVPVPTGASSGSVIVTVNGVQSNPSSFTLLTPPAITGILPSSSPVGAAIAISGTNFGTVKGTVAFNATQATNITNWTAGTINLTVPTGATVGADNVVVKASGISSNAVPFTVLATPKITSLSPISGKVAAAVTINGSNFGSQSAGSVAFNGTLVTSFTSWTSTVIKLKVPTGAKTGNVVVTASGVPSNGVKFTVN